MGNCEYCLDAVGPDNTEPHIHDACFQEFGSRVGNGLCVKCAGPGRGDGYLCCEQCVSYDASYSGYPGGS